MKLWVVRLIAISLPMTLGAGLALAQQQYPPPISHDASKKAREQVMAVEKELGKAELAVKNVQAKLQKEFETSSEFTSAENALKSAQGEYESLTKPILQSVRTKPEYKAAIAAKLKRQEELDAIKKDPDVPKEKVNAAAAEVLKAGSVASKMESDALAAEPQIATTRAAIAEADKSLTALRQQFLETLRADKDWLKARKDADAVKVKVAAAQQTLRQAVQQEATAENARQQQIAAINRSNNQNNNNNRNNNNMRR